jgi:hypothetical protein
MKKYYIEYNFIEDGWQTLWTNQKSNTLASVIKEIAKEIKQSISINGKNPKNYRIKEITEKIISYK